MKKIVCYNVNGIRAVINKGFVNWLKHENPDIVCLQEIKLHQPELVESYFKELGYHCFWYPAQKKGYSGVGVLTRTLPNAVQYGIGIAAHDSEGRVMRCSFDMFELVVAYFPSGSAGEHRQDVKYQFLEDFSVYIQGLQQNTSRPFVICGDMNICHEAIDIHNPIANKNTSGFLPEERAWFSNFLSLNLTDVFRFFYPEVKRYTWWTYRAGAKDKNLGWRIDYFLVSPTFLVNIKDVGMYEALRYSDHCPIYLDLSDAHE